MDCSRDSSAKKTVVIYSIVVLQTWEQKAPMLLLLMFENDHKSFSLVDIISNQLHTSQGMHSLEFHPH